MQIESENWCALNFPEGVLSGASYQLHSVGENEMAWARCQIELSIA